MIQKIFWHRRYLRAIPSLVVLTTAMAWGVSPDAEIIGSAQKNISWQQSRVSDSHQNLLANQKLDT
ncbi:hypothetical protein HC248_00005 [Polaromonas vacuolata]|uniref:Uncharacterized protein n=1 Tax=Polaromonas vacuolata TaxID=37448 RepID=A0A6H2H4L5_9BURK|nr:hypothetical protein [Polaromonas vacuolata]QJC54743.1 hypothetical protein HC248_00005 [Polaromonas vacuolata]